MFSLGDGRSGETCYTLKVAYEIAREIDKFGESLSRSILEVGSGRSATGAIVSRVLLTNVTQIDHKEDMTLLSDQFQTYIHGDILDWDFGHQRFDFSFAQGLLGWVPNALNIVRRMVALTNTAVIVVDDPERFDHRPFSSCRMVTKRPIPLRVMTREHRPHCAFNIWTFAL